MSLFLNPFFFLIFCVCRIRVSGPQFVLLLPECCLEFLEHLIMAEDTKKDSSEAGFHKSSEQFIEMENDATQQLKDYSMSSLMDIQFSIVIYTNITHTFKIKLSKIQMIQMSLQFGGLAMEDLNNHIPKFIEVCDTFMYNNVLEDVMNLRLCPFSPRDQEKVCYVHYLKVQSLHGMIFLKSSW